MHFSTQVDFSRRYGKSVGSNISGFDYQVKKKLETIPKKEQQKLVSENIEQVIKTDLLLSEWLYYVDYETFIKEFKNYIIVMPYYEFNLIITSCVHLGTILEIFWLESNDPTLKSEYTPEKALESYKKSVEKNGYKFDETEERVRDDGFKIIIKNLFYKHNNEELYQTLFKLKQELKFARIDDILQCRTKENWEILYSLRHIYKNVVNMLLDKKNTGKDMFAHSQNNRRIELDTSFNVTKTIDNISVDELLILKKNLEDYLMGYQESTEGLEWHNSFSDKPIETIEYFPRETSKPPHEWAYSKYYDLENNAHVVVNNMVNTRKRKRDEYKSDLTERMNKIKDSMEKRNERIIRTAQYISNGIYYGIRLSVLIAIGAIAYSFYYN